MTHPKGSFVFPDSNLRKFTAGGHPSNTSRHPFRPAGEIREPQNTLNAVSTPQAGKHDLKSGDDFSNFVFAKRNNLEPFTTHTIPKHHLTPAPAPAPAPTPTPHINPSQVIPNQQQTSQLQLNPIMHPEGGPIRSDGFGDQPSQREIDTGNGRQPTSHITDAFLITASSTHDVLYNQVISPSSSPFTSSQGQRRVEERLIESQSQLSINGDESRFKVTTREEEMDGYSQVTTIEETQYPKLGNREGHDGDSQVTTIEETPYPKLGNREGHDGDSQMTSIEETQHPDLGTRDGNKDEDSQFTTIDETPREVVMESNLKSILSPEDSPHEGTRGGMLGMLSRNARGVTVSDVAEEDHEARYQDNYPCRKDDMVDGTGPREVSFTNRDISVDHSGVLAVKDNEVVLDDQNMEDMQQVNEEVLIETVLPAKVQRTAHATPRIHHSTPPISNVCRQAIDVPSPSRGARKQTPAESGVQKSRGQVVVQKVQTGEAPVHLRLRSSAVSPQSPSHHVHIANLSPTACPSASSPPLKHPQPQPPHIRTSHLLLSETRTLPSKHINSYDLYNPLNTGRRTSTTDDNSRSPVRQGFRATPRTPSKSKPDNSLMDAVISSLSRPGSPRIKSSLGGVIVGSKRVPVVARQNAAKKQGQQACLHATALLQTLAPGSNTPQKDDSATQFLDETELPLEEQAAAATQTANEALTMFSKWAEREKLHISTSEKLQQIRSQAKELQLEKDNLELEKVALQKLVSDLQAAKQRLLGEYKQKIGLLSDKIEAWPREVRTAHKAWKATAPVVQKADKEDCKGWKDLRQAAELPLASGRLAMQKVAECREAMAATKRELRERDETIAKLRTELDAHLKNDVVDDVEDLVQEPLVDIEAAITAQVELQIKAVTAELRSKENLQSDIEALKVDVESVEKEKGDLEEDLARRKQELTEYKTEVDELRGQYQALTKQVSDMQTRENELLDAIRTATVEQTKIKTTLELKIEELHRRCSSADQQICDKEESWGTERQGLQDKLDSLGETLEEKEKNLKEAVKQVSAAKESADELKRQVDQMVPLSELEAAANEHATELQRLRTQSKNDLDQAHSKIKDLEEAARSLAVQKRQAITRTDNEQVALLTKEKEDAQRQVQKLNKQVQDLQKPPRYPPIKKADHDRVQKQLSEAIAQRDQLKGALCGYSKEELKFLPSLLETLDEADVAIFQSINGAVGKQLRDYEEKIQELQHTLSERERMLAKKNTNGRNLMPENGWSSPADSHARRGRRGLADPVQFPSSPTPARRGSRIQMEDISSDLTQVPSIDEGSGEDDPIENNEAEIPQKTSLHPQPQSILKRGDCVKSPIEKSVKWGPLATADAEADDGLQVESSRKRDAEAADLPSDPYDKPTIRRK